MRQPRVRRLPPRGEGTSKNKDRERRTNDYNHNPAELHLDPPGWVSFQTLPWVKIRPLLTRRWWYSPPSPREEAPVELGAKPPVNGISRYPAISSSERLPGVVPVPFRSVPMETTQAAPG